MDILRKVGFDNACPYNALIAIYTSKQQTF